MRSEVVLGNVALRMGKVSCPASRQCWITRRIVLTVSEPRSESGL